METYTPAKTSALHAPVPKAVSNSALMAIVAMCYVMLVAPTLEFVSTANMLRNDGFGTAPMYQITKPGIEAANAYKSIKTVQLKGQDTLTLVVDSQNNFSNVVSPAPVVQSGPSVDAFITPKKVSQTIPASALAVNATSSDVLKAAANAVSATNPGNPAMVDSTMPTGNGAMPSAAMPNTQALTLVPALDAAKQQEIADIQIIKAEFDRMIENNELKSLEPEQLDRIHKQMASAMGRLFELFSETMVGTTPVSAPVNSLLIDPSFEPGTQPINSNAPMVIPPTTGTKPPTGTVSSPPPKGGTTHSAAGTKPVTLAEELEME